MEGTPESFEATKKQCMKLQGAIAITFDGSGIYSCSSCRDQWVFYRQFSITMATAIILSEL
jgi:hypothetical protein